MSSFVRTFVLCSIGSTAGLLAPAVWANDPNSGDSSSGDTRSAETGPAAVALLGRYCLPCHGGGQGKPKGKVDLRVLKASDDFVRHVELSRRLLEALSAREMPPEDGKQPTDAHRKELITALEHAIDEHLSTASLPPLVMRRLNRYEYSNAVRDLLSLKGDIYPLPEKSIRAGRPYYDPASGRFPESVRVGNRPLGKFQVEQQILAGVVPFAVDLQAEHGFNNQGDQLSVSPILLESFLKLGRSIVQSPQFPSYCSEYANLFEPSGEDPAGAPPADPTAVARPRLASLLERAFRSPVDSPTVDRYVAFFEAELRRTASFSEAMKSVVAAVITSPRFLYLVEEKAAAAGKTRLTDYELATRLSFFLWSSIPDADLLDRARSGDLQDRAVLIREIRRMLAHPRSKALADNFARQWLRLDQLITAVPDQARFPTYYSRIGCEYWKFGLQMMVEPLLLFESILVEDRSILLLIDSDYSYRSDELQTWYASPDPFAERDIRNRFNTNQQTFKRRKLTSRREGGVLTTAAILTMTSTPLRTSPIVRGSWVAGVIFNRPPAPPPDEVPEIEADDRVIEAAGKTLRERLVEHQTNETCRSCHAKIDPLGFALENFDAVGRWRSAYRSGLKINAAGVLFGEQPFQDIEEFKDAVLERPERFVRAFVEHLLAYALGRELKTGDKPAVDAIVENVLADGGRLSRIIVEVAISEPFLHKTNQVSGHAPNERLGRSEHGQRQDGQRQDGR